MKKYILLISLFFSLNLFSQNVSIKGVVNSVSNSRNSLIRLMTYDDMLTYEQTCIYETKTDDDGDFIIEANIDDVVMAQIAVGLERVDILLKPNSNYRIEIDIPVQEKNVSYFERQNPSMKILETDDDDLYYQYHVSGMIIDDFLLNNFNRIYKGRRLSLLDTLDVKIDNILGDIKSDFVKDNVRYRKAAIQMVINNDRAQKVTNQYFNKQEVLYSNPAYMSLFYDIFTDYLTSPQFNPSDIRYLLYSDYDRFLTYLKEKDAFLSENHVLAELIVAWNLKRMYYEMTDDRAKIYNYLNHIAKNTENQNNKKVVDDILKQLDRLAFNTDAPDFSLYDKNGNVVRLTDYSDNMILLQFVDQYSTMLDYQFDVLKELSLQWQDSVKIITIATEECIDDYVQIFDNKGYDWKLLNLGDDILLLEEYQIKTYPDYVILGKNAKVGMAPAPAPDQYLDFHVRRIYNYYKK